jgi:hypothetical protein
MTRDKRETIAWQDIGKKLKEQEEERKKIHEESLRNDPDQWKPTVDAPSDVVLDNAFDSYNDPNE